MTLECYVPRNLIDIAYVSNKDSKDPAANREMGRYFCLVKGNWERGLPMLVVGNDKDYLDLAKRDLRKRHRALMFIQNLDH